MQKEHVKGLSRISSYNLSSCLLHHKPMKIIVIALEISLIKMIYFSYIWHGQLFFEARFIGYIFSLWYNCIITHLCRTLWSCNVSSCPSQTEYRKSTDLEYQMLTISTSLWQPEINWKKDTISSSKLHSNFDLIATLFSNNFITRHHSHIGLDGWSYNQNSFIKIMKIYLTAPRSKNNS